MAAEGTQHLGAEVALVFAQQAENAGHAADAVGDFGEEFSRRTAAELMQVLGTTLQAEPVEGIEVDHSGGLSAPR
jgi:hypothetical protein